MILGDIMMGDRPIVGDDSVAIDVCLPILY